MRRTERAQRGRPAAQGAAESLPKRDGALQTTPGQTETPPPSLTFEGVNNMCGCYPPDTNGDVGGTQYMQWVNLHFAIYDKNTGAQVQAPRPGNQLFTGVPVCGTRTRATRSRSTTSTRIAGSRASSATRIAPYYQCVAVSTTDDATGTWCAYGFNVHNTKFNDYPKMGVWPAQNAYTMTANQFPPSGFGGVGVWAFERDQMIATGCPAARMVYQDMDRDRAVSLDDHSGRRRRRHAASGQRAGTVRLDQPGRLRPSERPDPDLECDGQLEWDPVDGGYARRATFRLPRSTRTSATSETASRSRGRP